jgi:hypothetical protein
MPRADGTQQRRGVAVPIAENVSSELIAKTDAGAGPRVLNLCRMMTRTSDSAAKGHTRLR